jgi:serine/threonine-protein kinase RsbW
VSRTDQIHLELPAVPAYGRVMRIAAAHLALRRGFSLHEIDDLRLAMDEAAVLLLGPDVGGDRVEIDYAVEASSLGIEASVEGDGVQPLTAGAVERFEAIVGELVDDHLVDAEQRRITVTKRHR